MKDIFVDIREENTTIRKYFDDKDLISVDDLLGTIKDLLCEIDRLKEKIEDR